MKKHLTAIVTMALLLPFLHVCSQVKIGNNPSTINPASLLELESANKGLLLPRVSDTTSISAAPSGMFMFRNADSSLYFKRTHSWQRLSLGNDNFWQLYGANIYSTTNVGINYATPANPFFIGTYAPFQTYGMVGNTLAMFGQGSPGISLAGTIPGVYFNSYYGAGNTYGMSVGNTANISLSQTNTTGGDLEFSLSGYSGISGTTLTNHVKMYLNNDGKLGLNIGGVPTRAYFEQQGTVGNACAIFGGEGTGVAIEEHYPSIGFNSYYSGSGHSSIAAGYGGEIGVNQDNGNFYILNFTGASGAANSAYTSIVTNFNITPAGNIGINTTSPQSQVEIVNANHGNPSSGLTFTDLGYSLNMQGYNGGLLIESNSSGSWASISEIETNGTYFTISDRTAKKEIQSLNNEEMLQKLLLLKPSNYYFINDNENSSRSYGFISQDVEQLFPEFVSTVKDKKLLSYSSFVPVIVAAVQEQQQQINTLQKQNASATDLQKENEDLKSQLATLAATVKQLQQQVNALTAIAKSN